MVSACPELRIFQEDGARTEGVGAVEPREI